MIHLSFVSNRLFANEIYQCYFILSTKVGQIHCASYKLWNIILKPTFALFLSFTIVNALSSAVLMLSFALAYAHSFSLSLLSLCTLHAMSVLTLTVNPHCMLYALCRISHAFTTRRLPR